MNRFKRVRHLWSRYCDRQVVNGTLQRRQNRKYPLTRGSFRYLRAALPYTCYAHWQSRFIPLAQSGTRVHQKNVQMILFPWTSLHEYWTNPRDAAASVPNVRKFYALCINIINIRVGTMFYFVKWKYTLLGAIRQFSCINRQKRGSVIHLILYETLFLRYCNKDWLQ